MCASNASTLEAQAGGFPAPIQLGLHSVSSQKRRMGWKKGKEKKKGGEMTEGGMERVKNIPWEI